MTALLLFIDQVVIPLLIYVVVASVIMSWLIAFNVVNQHNQFVRALWNAFNAVTEPMLRPIRRRLPDLGGIDISPMIFILGLLLLRYVINYEILPRLA
jgi:YggT family protein